jgi:peptidoglycan hydrolase CwlO-like protein
LQNKIAELQNKINELQSQEKTLSSQIAIMDSQIKLTEYKIQATQEQITSLTLDIDTVSKKIISLQNSLNNSISILLNRIVATYEVGTIQPLQILLTSGNASNFLTRLNYLRLAQVHDKELIYDTQQAKVDYANQKAIFENEKKQVEILNQQLKNYTDQLNQEKQAKQNLLAQTKGSESNYQMLLAQAQAQLLSLSSFSSQRAGSGGQIIPHEDISDSWGKYYNQRDSNWGNNLIGFSSEQIWSVGCLLTSFAMVSTHFGGEITPADVAASASNFFGNTAYFLQPGPSANGHPAQYVSNPSLNDLRNVLNNGGVVIAGISSNGGPYPQHYSDHWVVLRSVDGDSFKINDPWYQNAMNVSFNDHYSGWSIIEARIYY